MEQFEVIKRVTLILGHMLEDRVSAALGRKIKVGYEYSSDAREGDGSISVIHCGLVRRGGSRDREHEWAGGGERFRNPPLLLRSRYLISAWATPPDDQEILGAILRTFLDHPVLEPRDADEEEVVAYAGTPSIDLETLSLEEHHRLVQAAGMPLAPSACYWVDFRLQSGKTTPIKRVKERVIDYRKIEG